MAMPETPFLPFNQATIRDAFTPGPPDADKPGVPGYWLILRGEDMLTRDNDGQPDLPCGALPVMASWKLPPVHVGTWLGQPLRAARLAADAPIPPGFAASHAGYRRSPLSDRLLTLAGLARQVLHWRSRSRVCSACGGVPAPVAGTFGVRCTCCGREFFPRIHPAIIVLVRRGEEFLLVRKAQWPAGQYGLVAGFVEFAESLEECVAREVKEETGVSVANARYLCSQNWPYPSQIMAGFEAEYVSGDIRVEPTELEHAAWFAPDRLPPALSPPGSTARFLIDKYGLGL